MQGNQCGLCSIVCATLFSCVLVLQQVESFIGPAIHQTHTEHILHMLVPSPWNYRRKESIQITSLMKFTFEKGGKINKYLC